jgi:hypothetical protein
MNNEKKYFIFNFLKEVNYMVTLSDLQDTLDRTIIEIQKDPIMNRIWEESIARQKTIDEVRRKEIVNLLQESIDDSIDTLKTCTRILEAIKDEQSGDIRVLGLDKLQQEYDYLNTLAERQDDYINQLVEVIK